MPEQTYVRMYVLQALLRITHICITSAVLFAVERILCDNLYLYWKTSTISAIYIIWNFNLRLHSSLYYHSLNKLTEIVYTMH